MSITDFVEYLMPNGWSDTDSRDAIIAEVEVLMGEIGDEVLVREITANIFEAAKAELE